MGLSVALRRKIAMARVLAKDAPILLLDDPLEGSTELLDTNTQQHIVRALEGFMAGRTVRGREREREAGGGGETKGGRVVVM